MVPAQVTLVPSFLVVVNLGLVDTIWAVILPRAGDAIAIFIARQFMLKIPDALLEAARIDGAGESGRSCRGSRAPGSSEAIGRTIEPDL